MENKTPAICSDAPRVCSFSALLREASLPTSEATLKLLLTTDIKAVGVLGTTKLYLVSDVTKLKEAAAKRDAQEAR